MNIDNQTPFVADLTISHNRDGREQLVVILKATYRVHDHGAPEPAEEQSPVIPADVYHGEPATSSLFFESELMPKKPATDVVLVGHAYAPHQRPATQVDVGLRVGPVSKIIRVFGDRYWDIGLLRQRQTPPLPFEKMPLIFERAFGGEDREGEEGKRKREPRNPVGRGYFWPSNPAKTWPLPNLEDPKALINNLRDRPPPVCFGFVGRHWQPRVDLVGTYDEAWQQARFPLLPEDFDERHFNAAHPDLITQTHLQGDEPVEAHHVTATSTPWRFNLPGYRPHAEVSVGNQKEAVQLDFDTLLLQPDEDQFSMIWRGNLDIHNQLLKVTKIQVKGS